MSTPKEKLSKLQLLRTELSIVNVKLRDYSHWSPQYSLREFSTNQLRHMENALTAIKQAEAFLALEAMQLGWIVEKQRKADEARVAYCKIEDEYRQPL